MPIQLGMSEEKVQKVFVFGGLCQRRNRGWLPWPILRKKQFPKLKFKPKGGITECEHRRIIGREINPERRDFYELCWLLGGSQGRDRQSARRGHGLERPAHLLQPEENAPADAGESQPQAPHDQVRQED
jgi:hypothetical protein